LRAKHNAKRAEAWVGAQRVFGLIDRRQRRALRASRVVFVRRMCGSKYGAMYGVVSVRRTVLVRLKNPLSLYTESSFSSSFSALKASIDKTRLD
jgi:hypothetical protein